MQNKPLLLAIALSICAGASSCKKENPDPDGLAPATQEGKGTGDFLLNGVAFSPRPSVSSPSTNPVGVTAYPGRLPHTRDFEFVFYRMIDRNRVDTFNLILNAVTTSGTYLLNLPVNPHVVTGANQSLAVFTQVLPTPERMFVTGPTSVGRITITRLDTTAHIISGTFDAKLKEYQGTDSVSITKGRFDLKF